MLKVWKTIEQTSLFWILAFFSFIYLAIAFPFSFFRHDDWLMIGNVARIVPHHWKFIFEPYLVFNSVPEIWFFRPWFKLILYVLYQTFGFHYYAWLAVNLLFTLGALLLGYLTVRDISQNRNNAFIFILFFVFSFHFHFASLVWVGEGTMNCPQIFLLFLNFYFFNQSLGETGKSKALLFYIGGMLAFILSLGFKEAAILHLPFLLIILFRNPKIYQLTLIRKASYLFPYFIVACTYLYFRFFFIPFNPGYKPRGDLTWYVTPIFFLTASLLLPLGALWISILRSKSGRLVTTKQILKLTFYLIFFVPFFVTYMGHGFFSPGWLLAPGFYFAFIVAIFFPKTIQNPKTILLSAVITFIFSIGLVFYQTNQLSWWHWYRPQRQILEIISHVATSDTEIINIYNCEPNEKNVPHLHRVVGYSDSIQEMFWLAHKKLPKVNVTGCETLTKDSLKTNPSTLSLKWTFPEFSVLVN